MFVFWNTTLQKNCVLLYFLKQLHDSYPTPFTASALCFPLKKCSQENLLGILCIFAAVTYACTPAPVCWNTCNLHRGSVPLCHHYVTAMSLLPDLRALQSRLIPPSALNSDPLRLRIYLAFPSGMAAAAERADLSFWTQKELLRKPAVCRGTQMTCRCAPGALTCLAGTGLTTSRS